MSFWPIKNKKSTTRLRNHPISKPLFLSSPFIDASLVEGSFKKIVILPKCVEEDEWLAVNVFEFFTYLNMFYGTVTDFCTALNCPTMNAGPGVEAYTWTDQNQKKTTKLPAPTYIDYVMTLVQNLVNDENVFPTKVGREFSKDFQQTVRLIFKQCFRVFAHIYYHHYEQILHLREEKHFNSLFAHFMSFSKEFNLLSDKKELVPLEELITYMESNGRIS